MLSSTCAVTQSPGVSGPAGRPGASAAILGSALLECDGRTLVVQATYPHVLACGEVPSLVAKEEADRVLISVRLMVRSVSPHTLCAAVAVVGGTSQVRLRAPLGGRMLVDAVTGHRIAVLDERSLQHVTYLPSGYHVDPREPVRLTTATAPNSDPQNQPAAVVHLFAAGRIIPGEDDGGLFVTQTRGRIDPGQAAPVGTVVVHGQHAKVWDDQGIRYLIWQEDGWTLKVESMPTTMNGKPLSTGELQKIAQGMRAI
ncbi:hypothetical protein [Streptacidiphilus cavernicola]|uniref:Uncharacterized protein n=1 Tax=Streptacidiphilus cavernicola TaxID=3342716 RepID=A0ABV6W6D0_9ACTN